MSLLLFCWANSPDLASLAAGHDVNILTVQLLTTWVLSSILLTNTDVSLCTLAVNSMFFLFNRLSSHVKQMHVTAAFSMTMCCLHSSKALLLVHYWTGGGSITWAKMFCISRGVYYPQNVYLIYLCSEERMFCTYILLPNTSQCLCSLVLFLLWHNLSYTAQFVFVHCITSRAADGGAGGGRWHGLRERSVPDCRMPCDCGEFWKCSWVFGPGLA